MAVLIILISADPDDILNSANSVDPGEIQHHAAFHLGLHCMPKYPFSGFQYTMFSQLLQLNLVRRFSHVGCGCFLALAMSHLILLLLPLLLRDLFLILVLW